MGEVSIAGTVSGEGSAFAGDRYTSEGAVMDGAFPHRHFRHKNTSVSWTRETGDGQSWRITETLGLL